MPAQKHQPAKTDFSPRSSPNKHLFSQATKTCSLTTFVFIHYQDQKAEQVIEVKPYGMYVYTRFVKPMHQSSVGINNT